MSHFGLFLRGWISILRRDLPRSVSWSGRFWPIHPHVFWKPVSHSNLFSRSATDSFHHRDRGCARGSIRLLLSRLQERDVVSHPATISAVAHHRRNIFRGPTPSPCRRRIVPRECRPRTACTRQGGPRLP